MLKFLEFQIRTHIEIQKFKNPQFNMNKLLDIVEEDSFAGDIKEEKLQYFLSKLKIWGYAKTTQNENQNLGKKNQSSLLITYYKNMC